MALKQFFKELKKRNVYRVAITYAVVAWLILQIVSVVSPIIEAPAWVAKVALILLLVGFPIALILAWAYEMSPSGMVRTSSKNADENPYSGSKKKPLTSNLIIGALLVVIACQFVYNKFWNNSTQNEGIATENLNTAKSDDLISLAALPFSNISQEQEIDYLGFALVDQVISSLSYLQNVAVRPSSSIRKYSNQTAEPNQVSEALSVQYILMGHYIKNEDSLRLNLELIDVLENSILWRGSVQEQMENIFKLQDAVAEKVIDGLKIQFSPEERNRMVIDAPENPLAYEYFLKALALPQSVDGNRLAIGLLEKAAELDSNYSPIFAKLGNRVHNNASYSILDTKYKEVNKALGIQQKALSLNPEDLNALTYTSLIYTEINELEKALGVSKQILKINPNSPYGHFALGYVYRYAGMIDSSIALMEKAVSIDPKNVQFRSIGTTYSIAGKYDKAIKSLILEDGSGFKESMKGLTYIRMNELKLAEVEFNKVIQIDPDGTLGNWCRPMLAYSQGIKWNEELRNKTIEIGKIIEDPEAIFNWSIVYILHDEHEEFLKLYEKAVDLGFFPYPVFETDPILDPLRDNIEFQRITLKAKAKHEAFKEKYF